MFSIVENGVLKRFDTRDLDENGCFIVPNNITEIGVSAFLHCRQLQKIVIGENVTCINEGAFVYCSNLQDVVFNEKLTGIREKAFMSCESLQSLKFPHSLLSVGVDSFRGCTNLTEVVFNPLLIKLGKGCFSFCSNLKKVILSKRLSSIPADAFAYCSALTDINLESRLVSIGDKAFEACGFEQITLPDNIVRLGIGAFQNCADLTKISFSNALTEIPANICMSCGSLKQVVYPNNVTQIGTAAFYCTGLESAEIPSTVTQVDSRAYARSEIKYARLPQGVKEIGNLAFARCKDLSSIEYPANIDDCADDVFDDCSLSKIVITDGEMPKQEFVFDHFIGVRYDNHNYIEFLTALKEVDSHLRGIIPFDFYIQLPKSLQEDFVNSRFKGFNNLAKQLLMDNCKIYDAENKKNLLGFMKIAYNLGVFNPNLDISNRAYVFIKDELLNAEPFKNMDSLFGRLSVQSYNQQFVDFFIGNLHEILAHEKNNIGFTCKIINNFDEIQSYHKSHKGKQRQLAPTLEFFIQYYNENKFNGVNSQNERIAEELGKFYYKQETFDFAMQIMNEYYKNGMDLVVDGPFKEFRTLPIETCRMKYLGLAKKIGEDLTEITNRKYTYEWLKKDDPINLTMGKYCDCCAHLEGVGRYIVYASVTRPDMRNIVIRDEENRIVAKSTIYVNAEKGYAICNNFEISQTARHNSKKAIVNAFLRGVDDYISYYNTLNSNNPIVQVNVGRGFNDATQELLNISKIGKPQNLEGIHFSQYNPQKENCYDGDWQHGQICIWAIDESVEFLDD